MVLNGIAWLVGSKVALKLSNKALILVSVPVLFEIVLVSTLIYLNHEVEQERRGEAHARVIASSINSIISLHLKHGLLRAMGHDIPDMLEKASTAQQDMRAEVKHLEKIVEKYDDERESLMKITQLTERMAVVFEKAQEYSDKGDKAKVAKYWAEYLQGADTIFDLTDKLVRRNLVLVREHKERVEFLESLLQMVQWGFILGGIGLAFGLTIFFNQTTTNRLHKLMDTARRLGAGQPPAARLDGEDELAELDVVFHQLSHSLEALRRRERAILENAAEVIGSIDKDLRFVELNQATDRLWGYKAEELIGTRVMELIDESSQKQVFEKLEGAQAKLLPSEMTFESAIKKRDGTIAECAWSVNWSDEDQEFYCVIHDISERKKLDAMKREFVAMVSHDLRTPLSTVQLVHELIEDEAKEKLSDQANKELATVRDNISRLIALINNLLDLEKLESGSMDVDLRQQELAPVVTESISAVRSLGRSRKIELVSEISNDTMAYFDSERIIQVLVNLLSNALKYSPKSSQIKIISERTGDLIRVSVVDQGPGISEEGVARIFERFKQVSRDDERIHKGSGLGLAICKQIIECHYGTIGVESKVGEGSTFWFTLPASEAAVASKN